MASPFTTLAPRELLRHQAYINGHWQSATDGRTFAVINPAIYPRMKPKPPFAQPPMHCQHGASKRQNNAAKRCNAGFS